MAPPTLVYTRGEIFARHHRQLAAPAPENCSLKSLTQHECTFKVSETHPPEIICFPFKRVFQRCLESVVVKDPATGAKKTVDKWVNYEITSADTNDDLLTEPKYASAVQEFMSAEKELKKLMERELRE